MSNTVTLRIYEEEEGVFRAECEYPVVHAVGDTEDHAIARARDFIREMLREADSSLIPDPPTTLIIRVERKSGSAIIMQPLYATLQNSPTEAG